MESPIFLLMKQLTDMVTENKNNADYVFATVHRSKGLEYDEVEVLNDFITKGDIEEFIQREKDGHEVDWEIVNENINCLYVAITRATTKVNWE